MNKELKEQAHKEFREKFVTFKSWSNDSVGISVKTSPEDIENLIDSIIDKTVSNYQTNFEQKHIVSAVECERERIIGVIKNKKFKDEVMFDSLDYHQRQWFYKEIESIIHLIINKYMKYILKNKEIELTDEEVAEIVKQNSKPVEEKKVGIEIKKSQLDEFLKAIGVIMED